MALGEHFLHRVEVSDNDRTVAAAEVTISAGSGGTVQASLRSESGHITPGRRACLVDAVLDLAQMRGCARLLAVLPLGDHESLQRLRERCWNVSARAAGASAILEADLLPHG
jgi:hypothetical protein